MGRNTHRQTERKLKKHRERILAETEEHFFFLDWDLEILRVRKSDYRVDAVIVQESNPITQEEVERVMKWLAAAAPGPTPGTRE